MNLHMLKQMLNTNLTSVFFIIIAHKLEENHWKIYYFTYICDPLLEKLTPTYLPIYVTFEVIIDIC